MRRVLVMFAIVAMTAIAMLSLFAAGLVPSAHGDATGMLVANPAAGLAAMVLVILAAFFAARSVFVKNVQEY